MKTQIIRGEHLPMSLWAGGGSRQYYIYPPESSYAAKDFIFRMSMAMSDSDEEAAYSDLGGITRHLVMLEGEAHVFHHGHYDLLMKPYQEIDVFDGSWKSSAKGKVTDFNLMLGQGAQGKMSVVAADMEIDMERLAGEEPGEKRWLGLLCGAGEVRLCLPDAEKITLRQGELFLAEDFAKEKGVLNVILGTGKLIRMDVWL